MGFGLSFGSSKGKSNTSSTSTSQTGLPQEVINSIKGDAGGIYEKLKGQGYTEKQIAGMNESQLAALQKLETSGHLDSVLKQTQGGIDKLWQGVDGLSKIGEGALDQTTGQLTGDAMSIVNSDILKNQTDSIDRGAKSAVEQANALIGRNLRENEMTSIYRDAAGAGNVGSSRSAIAQGVAMRGAMDKSADVATNIFNAAENAKAGATSSMYNNALGMSQQMNQNNSSNRLQGILGSISGGNTAMSNLDRISGAGQQAIQNQLTAGGLKQNQQQAEMDNAYWNETQKKLKEAGVTDIETIMGILNQMNPLMDKTTTGNSSTTSKNTSFGGSFTGK